MHPLRDHFALCGFVYPAFAAVDFGGHGFGAEDAPDGGHEGGVADEVGGVGLGSGALVVVFQCPGLDGGLGVDGGLDEVGVKAQHGVAVWPGVAGGAFGEDGERLALAQVFGHDLDDAQHVAAALRSIKTVPLPVTSEPMSGQPATSALETKRTG